MSVLFLITFAVWCKACGYRNRIGALQTTWMQIWVLLLTGHITLHNDLISVKPFTVHGDGYIIQLCVHLSNSIFLNTCCVPGYRKQKRARREWSLAWLSCSYRSPGADREGQR